MTWKGWELEAGSGVGSCGAGDRGGPWTESHLAGWRGGTHTRHGKKQHCLEPAASWNWRLKKRKALVLLNDMASGDMKSSDRLNHMLLMTNSRWNAGQLNIVDDTIQNNTHRWEISAKGKGLPVQGPSVVFCIYSQTLKEIPGFHCS